MMPLPFPLPALLAASLTPLDAQGRPDGARLAAHVRTLLDGGCDGIVLFGTTGEGPALSARARMEALERLLESGLPAGRVMVGTAALALEDTVLATRHAVDAGCPVLVMPLFFFRTADDEGLFRAYATLIEKVGDPRLRLFLYNIPEMTGIGLSVALIERLIGAFPEVLAGIKDSSADWPFSEALLSSITDRPVFLGAEPHLPQAVRNGGAGAISGMANVVPGLVRRLLAGDEEARPTIERLIALVERHNFVAALKAVIAFERNDPAWRAVLPPVLPLAEDAAAALQADLTTAMRRATGF